MLGKRGGLSGQKQALNSCGNRGFGLSGGSGWLQVGQAKVPAGPAERTARHCLQRWNFRTFKPLARPSPGKRLQTRRRSMQQGVHL
jgi:hypothetical protein